MSRPRLFLVDSFGFIFRAYHARARSSAPPMRTSSGLQTEAVYIFHNMLRKLKAAHNPEFLAAVFESEGPTLREQEYAEYKANRPEMPEDLAGQIPWIGRLLASARLTYLPPESLLKKIDSVGKPISGVTIRILSDSGEVLGPGQTGELVAQGKNIMTGYFRDEEATKKALDRNGYHTGDLGHFDDDGFFYVTGRKDDQLKVEGHRINPQEIEDVIMESGRAVECIVFGIPDPLSGHRLAGLIVPIRNTPGAAAGVQEFCREKLPNYKIPKSLLIVDAIPKSNMGKPDRADSIRLFEIMYNKWEES